MPEMCRFLFRLLFENKSAFDFTVCFRKQLYFSKGILIVKKIFKRIQGKGLLFFGKFDKIDMLVCRLPQKSIFRRSACNVRIRRCSRMAKCEVCGKGVTFGIKVSHSHRRSNRTWKPNVKRVKAIVKGTPCHMYVCSRCLRSGKIERA